MLANLSLKHMRKQIVQTIDIISEVKDQYNLKGKNQFNHRIVNDAMHTVERRWEIVSFGIADVPCRKLRPHIKNTSHFKRLIEDWLIENSDELNQLLLKKSHGIDDEIRLINRFFNGEVVSEDISEFIELEASKEGNEDYNDSDDLITLELGLSLNGKIYKEGKVKLYLHVKKERNRKLIKDAKKLWNKEGVEQTRCSVCDFSFKEVYGEIGDDFIEAHHKQPISSLTQETKFCVEDLDPVCSNCHRMLHRKYPPLSVDELKKKISRIC